ncbi:hypothetical protein ACROYT_G014853 [Oculina patagonica]
MQQESLFKFLDAISDLCSDRQTVANVDLADNLNHACALMERDWPISLQHQKSSISSEKARIQAQGNDQGLASKAAKKDSQNFLGDSSANNNPSNDFIGLLMRPLKLTKLWEHRDA